MPVTLHVTPLDEHNSAAPLTTSPRPWPPIAITALSELADLQNNRSRAFAHQDVTCSSLLQAARAWPPRSYSCSFCKREFSSAQALGGHMNVHRRDRARLRRPSPPRSANIKDHSAAPNHLPPPPSQQVALSDYIQSRSISLLYPVFSDSLSSKLMFPTVPFLVSTSPFMSNSSSPALVSDPSYSSCPIDSSTSTISATLPRPAAASFPRPTPQSLSQAASNSLDIPLDGQTIAAQNCPPSSHVDKKCPCPSDHSIIHLKSESTRKKSLGFQPYRSLSFKDLDDSLHAPSRSDVEKDTIGLDLELRLG